MNARPVPAKTEIASSGPAEDAPVEIALHLARAKDAGDPYAFPFSKGHHGAFTYVRTRGDGTSESAELAWDEGIFADLQGLRSVTPDPARLPSLGGRLRGFLQPLGWDIDERALNPERTVRC